MGMTELTLLCWPTSIGLETEQDNDKVNAGHLYDRSITYVGRELRLSIDLF